MWKSERIPSSWNDSTIIQLKKLNSKVGDLDGICHIHDKNECYKFFGQIVIHCAKEPIFRNLPRNQIACRPGHRPSEHLFVLKSVMLYYESQRKCFPLAGYDMKKFFDFENLKDCMRSLYSIDVKGKLYRLLYNMNKRANIKVKTPVGISEAEETFDVVAQGSVEAALINSSNVGVGVEDKFKESEKEVLYYGIKLLPQRYMDDVLRGAENVHNAQHGNNLMEEMINEKLLEFNISKSTYTLLGSKTSRRSFKDMIAKNPLKLCNKVMDEAKSLKYLGDFITINVQESVHETVMKRLGIAKHTFIELRTVIEDTRSEKLGGINIALEIFNSSIVPAVLHNSETLINIPRKTLKTLTKLFNSFYQCIFRCCTGTPSANYY